MNKTVFDFVIFTAVFLFLQNGSGFAFDIKMNPNEVNGLLHKSVDITCNVEDSDNDVERVIFLELSKEDAPMVVLRQESDVSIGKDLISKIKAEGTIFPAISGSYIHAILSHPEPGSYTCLLYFLDGTNLLKEKRMNANLTVSNQEVKSAVEYLVDKVSSLEAKLEEQKNSSITKETKLQDQISLLNNRIKIQEKELEQQKNSSITNETKLQDQISLLNNRIKIQEKELEQQKKSLARQKGKDMVMFKALISKSKSATLKSGGGLVFGNIITNEGNAYNNLTGAFTAPFDGYYQFHLSLYVNVGSYIYVDLKSSTNEVLTKIFVGSHASATWEDYSDGNCVARLKAGEVVKPIVLLISVPFSLGGFDLLDPMNRFEGYLLQAL